MYTLFSVTIIKVVFTSLTNLNASKYLFQRIMKAIMLATIEFFEINTGGRIINRISNDTYEIDSHLSECLSNFLQELIMCIAYSIVITINIPWLSLC